MVLFKKLRKTSFNSFFSTKIIPILKLRLLRECQKLVLYFSDNYHITSDQDHLNTLNILEMGRVRGVLCNWVPLFSAKCPGFKH